MAVAVYIVGSPRAGATPIAFSNGSDATEIVIVAGPQAGASPVYIAGPREPGVVSVRSVGSARSISGSIGGSSVPVPVNSVLPAISGINDVGQPLTVSTGTWTNSPTSYSYQWKRGGSDIVGETASVYTLTPSDSGTAVTATVTASNAGGASLPATSSNSFTPPTYTLFDDFLTNAVAPLASPRTAEPGPGALAITDAGNILSVSAGELIVNGATSGANSGFIQNDAVTRAAGKAFGFYFGAMSNAGLGRVGLGTTLGSGLTYYLVLSTTNLSISDVGSHNSAVTPPYMIIYVERATGAFLIVGTRLVWVYRTNNSALKPVLWFASGQNPNMRIPFVKVEVLSSMDTDAEVYTTFSAAPVSGDTGTMEANALIDLDWTVVAAETLVIMFRRTDDDNTLKIECVQASNTIRFYRRVAGVDTEITPIFGTTTQIWTATTTYRITILTQGTAITSYVNGTLRNDGAAQTAQQSATGMKLTGFATIANWYAWRTDLSALVPAEFVPSWTTRYYLVIGDSKSLVTTWTPPFESLVNSGSVRWQRVATIAAVGRSVVVAQSTIDADLAALPATPAPEFLCINFGTNDVNGDSNDIYFNNPAEDGAPWIANYQYIIDAVRTKWSSCQVYVMQPWKPDYLGSFQVKLDVIGDTLLPSVISGRAWAHLGPDERVFLENGDGGATYITPPPDGLHPNSAGYALTAAQWKVTLGL